MGTKDKFEHESVQDHETISRYLKALMEGFENKQIVFDTADQQISLHPNNLIDFEISATKKSGRNKITLKFSWKDNLLDPNSHKAFGISTN